MLGSTYPVLSTISPLAFLRCTGQPCVHMGTPTMALESNTDIYKAADSTNIPLYVLKRANSWTRFSVTLQLCFFMKTLAIVLVGGAAKIAADGFFGVLTLLRLYTRPKGRTKIIFFCLLEYPHRSCLERRSERATAPLQWRK